MPSENVHQTAAINGYINVQPEAKRLDMQTLHDLILNTNPSCQLWFTDGRISLELLALFIYIFKGIAEYKYLFQDKCFSIQRGQKTININELKVPRVPKLRKGCNLMKDLFQFSFRTFFRKKYYKKSNDFMALHHQHAQVNRPLALGDSTRRRRPRQIV